MSYYVFAYAGRFMKRIEMGQLGRVSVGSRPNCNFVFPFLPRGFQTDLARLAADENMPLSVNPPLTIAVFQKQLVFGNAMQLQEDEVYTIGRSRDNALVFPTKLVSARHARMVCAENGWLLEDLRSTNGTYVNGQKIGQHLLRRGDIVHVAGWEFAYNGGTISFLSTPGDLHLNFRPVFVSGKKNEVEYPVFSRSPRVKTQPLEETIDFESPAYRQEMAQSSMLGSAVSSAAMSVMNPLSLLYSVPNFAVAGINRKKQKKLFREKEKARIERYNQYIAGLEADLGAKYAKQEALFHAVNPAPDKCVEIARQRQPRLWERTPWDADYLSVRLGLGDVPSGLDIRVPRTSINEITDELLQRPKELCAKYTTIQNAPHTINLKEEISVGITGVRDSVVSCVHNMILNVAVHHAYDEVKLVCLYGEEESERWDWVRWLPHAWNDDKSVRFTATNKQEAKELLREFDEVLKARKREMAEDDKYDKTTKLPYYIFVLADRTLAENHIIMRQLRGNDPYLGAITLLAYDDITLLPNSCRAIVECAEKQIVFYNREDYSAKKKCAPDRTNTGMLEAFSRALAPLRLKKMAAESSIPSCITFLQGYGVKKVDELNMLGRWAKSNPVKCIEAPLGVKHGGETFVFDLHEKEFGPHGLVAGTTGAGKSELLQTWLLSMALNYRPDEIAFVLIDFKGEGLAGALDKLPHTCGKISNLEIAGIKRNITALRAETVRRQAVFAASGQNIKDIYKYQDFYRQGKVDEAMPHLVIVIDEFAQMKKDYPDYMAEFTSIARVGRSLGVHLVLATQSPGGVVDQQVQSNIKFKMCLKTANTAESREMLGTSDAANLTVKGRAIIQVGNDEVYEQVQTFWSGAPYNPGGQFVKSSKKITIVGPLGQRIKPEVYDKTMTMRKSGQEEFTAIVDYIARETEKAGLSRARKIWEETLPARLYIEDLLKDAGAFENGAFTEKNQGFAPVLGLVDAPDQQIQFPLVADVAREGHTVFYGAPGTGKTTVLQTFILSAALMYTPRQVSIYVMDFGSWSMKTLEALPHVGGVANGNDAEKIKKLAEMLEQELSARKYVFSSEGVGSIETYREVSGKALPYIALVVDNFHSVLSTYPELDDFFLQLTREGGNLGIFLVATSGSVTGMGFKIAQNIKQSYALQMIDRADYITVVGRTEGLEPEKKPGRGLCRAGGVYEFQTALGVKAASEGEKIKKLRSLCAQLGNGWNGPVPKSIPVMPDILTQADMKCNAETVEVGLSVGDIMPEKIDFAESWFMAISGMPKSGKTNMLGVLLNGLMCDADTQVTVYEPRDKAFAPLAGRITHITAAADFDAFMAAMIPVLQERKKRYAGGERGFDRIAILVDDFDVCFERAEDQTITRLAQITKLAEGLDVHLYVAGRAGVFNQGDALSMCLVEAQHAVALGGDLLSHPNFRCDLTSGDKAEPMGAYEGYLFNTGRTEKFKAALAKKW